MHYEDPYQHHVPPEVRSYVGNGAEILAIWLEAEQFTHNLHVPMRRAVWWLKTVLGFLGCVIYMVMIYRMVEKGISNISFGSGIIMFYLGAFLFKMYHRHMEVPMPRYQGKHKK